MSAAVNMRRKPTPALKINARELPRHIASIAGKGKVEELARCERILADTLNELRRRKVSL